MNKIKDIIYNMARFIVRNKLTGNLGKVVEDDEKIICYVRNRKNKYTISCSGIRRSNQIMAEKYNLNKPIYYVIDGLNLKRHMTYIFGYDGCEVIIKNCNFGLELCINITGKCTIDNTNITAHSWSSVYATDLVVKNMNKDQIRVIGSNTHVCFAAHNSITIMDSNIDVKAKNTEISFNVTNDLNIINSTISSNKVECIASNINVDKKSLLKASDSVAIESNDYNPVNIIAPIVKLNNEIIKTPKEPITLKKITDPLSLKRLELINLLRNIKQQCEQISSKKISNYKEKINNQPISKTLKK